MAGFIGCAVQQDVENRLDVLDSGKQDPTKLLSFLSKNSDECRTKSLTDGDCDQANAIEGLEQGSTEWSPSKSTDPTDAGLTLETQSDAFTVRFMEDTNANLCTDMSTSSSNLVVSGQSSNITIGSSVFFEGGLYAAGDCEATNIFQLTDNAASAPFTLKHDATGTPGNDSGDLSKIYTMGSSGACVSPSAASPVDIFIFRARRYFIASEATIDDGRPALYRQTFDIPNDSDVPTVHSERLIDGVENMQVLYGEDINTAADPLDRVADIYSKATDVTDWSNVVSVKIALLFSTIEQDFSGPIDTKNDYQLLDEAAFDPTPDTAGCASPCRPPDHRRRKILEATVSLRNRQLSF